LRSYSFWIIVAVLFLDSISINGAMTHQVPLLTDRGIAAGSAASTVSVLGGASLSGRLSTGWLLDRFPGPWVAFVLLILASAGIFQLARASSFPQASVAAALLGLGAGGTSSITPYLLTRYFGLRPFSTLYGLTWTFYAIAGGAGPVLLGHAFDRTGSYTSTLTLLSFACALAAALMLLLPRYHISKHGEPPHASHCSS
jgi:cyanate permease